MRRSARNRTIWVLLAVLIIAIDAAMLRHLIDLHHRNARLRLFNRTLLEIAKQTNGVNHARSEALAQQRQ